MARVSPAVAAFVGGAVLATAVSALAQPGGADPGVNARATPAWLTVRVADAMRTDRTLTWVPTGSFGSSAEVRVPRYPSSPIRGTGPRPLSLLAVRNEQVSAQLAIASGHALHHVAAHVGDLTAPGGFRIPGASTQVRFVRYVPVERAASESEWSATLEQVSSPTEVSGDRDPDVVGDPLAEGASVDVPAYAAQPLWFTFRIPRTARPGAYTGTVRVTADDGTDVAYPLTVRVADAALPDPRAYRFFLDVWAQPETMALASGVPLWSERHWRLIAAYDRDLASRGQKMIDTAIVDDPWQHAWSLGTHRSQTATPYSSLVGWRWDGSRFSFDFSRWDRYVTTGLRAGLGPDIGAFSMLAFHDQEHLTYTDSRTGRTARENVALGGGRWRQAWGAFLTAFEQHLRARGWLGRTWLSFDERPVATLTAVRDFVHRTAPAFDHRIAVAGSADTAGLASSLSVGWDTLDRLTPGQIEQRRREGEITTFYVCGLPAHPNTFSWSPAVEARMLPWIAAQRHLDGFLRWSYDSWTDDPYTRPVFLFPQGDEYLVYPGREGPVSSVRWELLKDGIEDYELVAELRARDGGRDTPALARALALATRNLDGRTKDVTDIEAARAAVITALTS
jgi:hypothetical protein